jgi:hypothetical protein
MNLEPYTFMAAFATIIAAANPPANVIDLIERFGLIAGMLVFFIWRDYCNSKSREAERQELVARINLKEDQINQILKDTILQVTKAMNEFIQVAKECHSRNR